MFVDEAAVCITALDLETAQYWATYVSSSPTWRIHASSDTPVSSLFRGAYTSVEAHRVTRSTLHRYEEMIADMSAKGRTYSEVTQRFS